ncbi:hypothetical protein CcCBS67573_g03561 [Chytriomyces confervae]|uniref:Mitochondrial genome maintenance protein MGM101 n=1 Tax=Chytriomyces confervae TaxID=246404 RepID=A0A507FJC0_9FUNG|nr:hypothetical protein CcCBS67573_g03561 [Chytriomyces confervae]
MQRTLLRMPSILTRQALKPVGMRLPGAYMQSRFLATSEEGHALQAPTQSSTFQLDEPPTDGTASLTASFAGASTEAFPREAAEILMAPIDEADVEIKPDGLLYLPEIKYRRILNRAFGPGAWALVPRGPHTVSAKTLSREYALFCLGRFASVARGEQDFFDAENGLPTASEGVKSNAMLRCCKDLGIASELWDPSFIRDFKARNCVQVWGVSNSGMKKLLWRRNDRTLDAPWKESDGSAASTASSSYSSNKYTKKY